MPRTRTSKYQKKRQTRKNTPKKKDDIILSNAARSIAGNQVIDRLAIKVIENPSSRNMKRYSNAVASLLQSKVESNKSYAPSINEKLTSIRSQKYSDLFGCGAEFELGKTRAFNKLMIKAGSNCVPASSQEGRDILLKNFKSEKSIHCSSIIAPMQSHSNCWFNTMFISFFVSDKGRKFMRFFREMMIKGESATGVKISPPKLSEAMILFSTAIDACYNRGNSSKNIGLALNTNNIITSIYSSISGDFEGIKDVDQYGNPYKFYRDLMMYLGSERALKVEKIDDKDSVNNFLSMAGTSKSNPDIMIVTLSDFGDSKMAHPEDVDKIRTDVVFNGHRYNLDSAIVRDVTKNHFCCGITCNNKPVLFDGSAFSKLVSINWRSWLNKDYAWSVGDTNMQWNFKRGYSMLFYYRTT
jgi:hypothetical protein